MSIIRVMILGGTGQVGQALRASQPLGVEIIAPTRAQFDITDTGQFTAQLEAAAPDLVINCAAYNAVDRAEQERDRCLLINGQAVAALAEACDARATPLVHFSTDYVFPGRTGSSPTPYVEQDATGPVNHYGASKLIGEQAAARVARNLVLRVSWVFSEYADNMGVRILQRAMRGEPMAFATDQYGSPTYAGHIAGLLWTLAPGMANGEMPGGLFHLSGVGGSEPPASRYDLAQALVAEAQRQGLVAADYRVAATRQAEWEANYGRPPADRPQYSALTHDALATRLMQRLPVWREGLAACVAGLAARV